MRHFAPEAPDMSVPPKTPGEGYNVVIQPDSPAANELITRRATDTLFEAKRGSLGDRTSTSKRQYEDLFKPETMKAV